MSEYQYYEFQTLDRFLTEGEQSELRKITSRGDITHNSLTNVYHFGDFKGNPWKLMEKYFDVFLYVANWGTHRFMCRLPTALVSQKIISSYASSDQGEFFSFKPGNDNIIICFNSQDDESEYWEDDDSYMSLLIPLRENLMRGDLRCLYLGWLLRLQNGELKNNQVEPVVPAGLSNLSPVLKNLVKFLRIEESLIRAAAAGSPVLEKTVYNPENISTKLKEIPESQKDMWLLKLLEAKDPHFKLEVLRELQGSQESSEKVTLKRRTVSDLLKEQSRFKEKE
jgi:hypothetical protein